jgi:hypothetical protein
MSVGHYFENIESFLKGETIKLVLPLAQNVVYCERNQEAYIVLLRLSDRNKTEIMYPLSESALPIFTIHDKKPFESLEKEIVENKSIIRESLRQSSIILSDSIDIYGTAEIALNRLGDISQPLRTILEKVVAPIELIAHPGKLDKDKSVLDWMASNYVAATLLYEGGQAICPFVERSKPVNEAYLGFKIFGEQNMQRLNKVLNEAGDFVKSYDPFFRIPKYKEVAIELTNLLYPATQPI